ncbi:monofunctional biosynthetic peptidoglycan transglycosylase [Sphingopyxis panaciterrulae]|uniref:Biosynthetic peptidoglycan transglycosylase n=1 Tax=Sphingopyxis panaciterrulae TaxID=462372 RepID=A0A7W9EQC8_9SPHN|nr:monofunctional biosynthetic peptidoglycan transglycosylase [Sphingopyxis panaciterrulae]MBB5706527.1 monofunctional biosynthetic peptidoglycan transglycosylase [Sphingopyxis panaciterrulae]
MATKSRATKRRLPWYLRPFKWLLWFILISIAWVLVYAVVPPPVTFTMLADSSGIIKDWTGLSDIDRNMVRAVIAAEDGKFCNHDGFDRAAIEDAIERNAKGRKLRGGSTISQQTAKNVFLWQGSGWTRYVRKVPEVWFTFLIETIWGKRRIMEVYLNVAETGIGTYGVEAGAQRYFRHGAARLTPSEAARIAAILPLPKKREAISPSGFTRRYGNTIRARIGVVGRDGLDACVYR